MRETAPDRLISIVRTLPPGGKPWLAEKAVRRKAVGSTAARDKPVRRQSVGLKTGSDTLLGMSIRTLSTREVYRNNWLSVREDEIERSNGARGIYGVVDKEDCATILPIEGDTIVLVEQYRYTIGKRCLELPQGGWETAGIDPEELARGELREETGLLAAKMTYLGGIWIAYGFAKQRQHVYLATGLSDGVRDPDPEEHDLVMRRVTISEFEQMMFDGTIEDSTTLAAWGLYRVWRDRQQSGRNPITGPAQLRS
jgi:ADP-ribose pyrophosphatase